MKLIVLLFFGIFLTACGGGSNSSESSASKFSNGELVNNILLSKSIIEKNKLGDYNDAEGSLVFFNQTNLREFSLTKEPYVQGGVVRDIYQKAVYAEHSWVLLDDGSIQVSYPDGLTCYTKKKTQSSNRLQNETICSNDKKSEDTVLKPLPFNAEMLYGKSIKTVFEGEIQLYKFRADGSFNLTREDSDHIPEGIGTFENSVYKNAVKISYPTETKNDYSELFLVEGSLKKGKMLEVLYKKDGRYEVIMYTTSDSEPWYVNNYYLSVLAN